MEKSKSKKLVTVISNLMLILVATLGQENRQLQAGKAADGKGHLDGWPSSLGRTSPRNTRHTIPVTASSRKMSLKH